MNEDIYSGEVSNLVDLTSTIYQRVRNNSLCFIRGKPNVTTLASTINRKVIIENGVAVGVLAESEDGIMRNFKAKKEVFVASGVFESPKLLMLSGVSPKRPSSPTESILWWTPECRTKSDRSSHYAPRLPSKRWAGN